MMMMMMKLVMIVGISWKKKKIFHNPLIDIGTQTSFMNNIFLIAAAVIFSTPLVPWLRTKLQDSEAGQNAIGVSTLICNILILAAGTVLLVNSTNNPFLYWQF